MFLAALIIGAMTTYYLGLRNGITAAGVSLAIFVAALVIPGISLYAYGAVGLGVAALALAGPKLRPKYGLDARTVGAVRATVGRVVKVLRR